MVNEGFNIGKLLDFSPLGFYKIFGLAIKVAMILLLVFGVLWAKNMLFPAAPANVNQPEIKVEDGGKVEYNVIQTEDKRRLEYFIGGYANQDKEFGGFGGVKW